MLKFLILMRVLLLKGRGECSIQRVKTLSAPKRLGEKSEEMQQQLQCVADILVTDADETVALKDSLCSQCKWEKIIRETKKGNCIAAAIFALLTLNFFARILRTEIWVYFCNRGCANSNERVLN